MYNDFKEKYADKVNYESYRKILRSMSISFTKLGEEECEVCEVFKHHNCLPRTS